MKKFLLLLLLSNLAYTAMAKKIKFAVDMTGQAVSINGVHLVGDFQALIGLGPDWDPAKIALSQEGSSNVYSTVLNLPAFKKYEYRFVNGDLSYEAEFVPEESRVGFNFNDNRWIYLDSLANDTTAVGAILYAANAPAGKKLIRYKVDMTYVYNLPIGGVHVGTNYQNYDPNKYRLYSFANSVYEIIDYQNAGAYTFRYFSGNNSGTSETVPGTCANGLNRSINVNKDTVLVAVCFSGCAICPGLGLAESKPQDFVLAVYPNPAKGSVRIQTTLNDVKSVRILALTGKELRTFESPARGEALNVSDLQNGIYLLELHSDTGIKYTSRLMIQE